MKITAKKLKFYLQHLDFVWSLPLAWGVTMFLWYFSDSLFGTIGRFDPAFIFPIFHAMAIMTAANAIAIGALYFNFRGAYVYIFGYCKDGTWINPSKLDFQLLKPWQKIFIVLFLYFIYFLVAITVWHWIGASTSSTATAQ
jgi:hypothetical protein